MYLSARTNSQWKDEHSKFVVNIHVDTNNTVRLRVRTTPLFYWTRFDGSVSLTLPTEVSGYDPIFGTSAIIGNDNWSLGAEIDTRSGFHFAGSLNFERSSISLSSCFEAAASMSEVQFEFSWGKNDEKIMECGVQILAEEGEIKLFSYLDDPNREVRFLNCVKLDEQARSAIIQRWGYKFVCLPGKEIPAEFTHKAKGSSIPICEGNFYASSRFKACILLSPNLEHPTKFGYNIFCRLRSKGVLINEFECQSQPQILTEHLFVFLGALFKEHICAEVESTTSEIQFDFEMVLNKFLTNDTVIDDKIIECGVQMVAEEGESSSSRWKKQSDEAVGVSKDERVVKSSKHTCWRSWLKKLVWRRRTDKHDGVK